MNPIEVIKEKFGREVELKNGKYYVTLGKDYSYEFPENDNLDLHLEVIESKMLRYGIARYDKEGKLITQGVNLTGRKHGVRNKSTLFKEAMKNGFEELLEVEGKRVFLATVQAAVGRRARDEETGELLFDESGNPLYEGGSDAARKMILDRIVPVADVDKVDLNKFNISINVTGMTPKVEVMEGEIVDEQ
jgi:hypothetical protein